MDFGNSFDDQAQLADSCFEMFNKCMRSPSERSVKSEDDSPLRKKKLCSPKKRRMKFLNEPTKIIGESPQIDIENDYT